MTCSLWSLRTHENGILSGSEASWQWLIPAGRSECRPQCWSLSLTHPAPKQDVSCLRRAEEDVAWLQERKSAWHSRRSRVDTHKTPTSSFCWVHRCLCWIRTAFCCRQEIKNRTPPVTDDSLKLVPQSSGALGGKLQRDGWIVSVIVITVLLLRCICLCTVSVLFFWSNCFETAELEVSKEQQLDGKRRRAAKLQQTSFIFLLSTI